MIHVIEEERIPEELVRNSLKLMIIDFYADWCIPCQMLTPVLEEIDKKYPNVEIYRVNLEESNNYALTKDIKSIPTLIFYRDSEEVERTVGLVSMDKISEIIDTYNVEA